MMSMSGTSGEAEWVSVQQAAVGVGVSERTCWRWVQANLVEHRVEKRGGREVRVINPASMPIPDSAPDSRSGTPGFDRHAPDFGGHVSDGVGLNDRGHDLSLFTVIQAERDRLAEQVQQLQERLAASQRGEEQLRQLLAHAQQMNNQISEALIQKALPPAPGADPVPPPRQVRWWNPSTWRG